MSAIQNISFLRNCNELGIRPLWNILYGFNGENESDYEEMLSKIPILYHLGPPSTVAQIRLDRFSPNYKKASDFGYSQVQPQKSYRIVFKETCKLDELAYFFDCQVTDKCLSDLLRLRLHNIWEYWKKSMAELKVVSIQDRIIMDSRLAVTQWHNVSDLEMVILSDADDVMDIQDSANRNAVKYRTTSPDVANALRSLEQRGLIFVERGKYTRLVCFPT